MFNHIPCDVQAMDRQKLLDRKHRMFVVTVLTMPDPSFSLIQNNVWWTPPGKEYSRIWYSPKTFSAMNCCKINHASTYCPKYYKFMKSRDYNSVFAPPSDVYAHSRSCSPFCLFCKCGTKRNYFLPFHNNRNHQVQREEDS